MYISYPPPATYMRPSKAIACYIYAAPIYMRPPGYSLPIYIAGYSLYMYISSTCYIYAAPRL